MASESLAKRFYVSGTVQGVGFRFFVERVAARLNVSGYVRNLFDGRVEVYAIGTPAQIDTLRSELECGPRMGRVDRILESDAEVVPEYANGFTIERDD
jgi:acylphosphatase